MHGLAIGIFKLTLVLKRRRVKDCQKLPQTNVYPSYKIGRWAMLYTFRIPRKDFLIAPLHTLPPHTRRPHCCAIFVCFHVLIDKIINLEDHLFKNIFPRANPPTNPHKRTEHIDQFDCYYKAALLRLLVDVLTIRSVSEKLSHPSRWRNYVADLAWRCVA